MRVETMLVPSGRTYGPRELELVRGLARAKTIRLLDKPIILNGELESILWVGGRHDLSKNIDVLDLLGQAIFEGVKCCIEQNEIGWIRKPCLIGLPVAGTKLAQSAAQQSGGRACFVTMRTERKDHGFGSGCWIEDEIDLDRYQYYSLDNAVTTGKAFYTHIPRLKEDGHLVRDMTHIVLVDRQQGGVERIRNDGFTVEVLFNLLDIVYAFGELGLWTPEQVAIANEEIARNHISLHPQALLL